MRLQHRFLRFKNLTMNKPVITSTIYCSFREFYWRAECLMEGQHFETESRLHGGARQAADEILDQVRKVNENAKITMRRLFPKQYEISIAKSAS